MSAPGPPKPSSVLIVDDHPLVREGLSQLIAHQSDMYVCAQAADCAEALTQALRTQPTVAIVDLSLNGESGLDLVRQLVELDRAPRVLVLSMHEESTYAERAMRAGAFGYLMKRESSGRIVDALRAVIRGEFRVSAPVAERLAESLLGRKNTCASGVGGLTEREFEVFSLLGQGMENRQIAEQLHLSLKTVQTHCANIKDKLGVPNGTLLLREAVRWAESS